MSTMIPRIEMDQLPAALAAALRPRVERLGYLGEFFKCAAHQPKALLSFMALTADLKEALPDNLTEVVALTVAALTGNLYERNQHERLCRTLRLDDAWITAVNALQPDSGGLLHAHERLAQRLTIAAVQGHGHHARPALEAVAQALGPVAAVAILMLIGRYVSHAIIVNALELTPPVASPFEMPQP